MIFGEPGLVLRAHASTGYRERTKENANAAGLTVAFAVDFDTAGERLTRQAARAYVAVSLKPEDDVYAAASAILRTKCRHLNIAGNGLHTLSKHGWDQRRINEYVYQVLRVVHRQLPLTHIRSGGQTGADTAGIVAALALGVPATALFPKHFLQRDADGADYRADPKRFRLLCKIDAQEVGALE